MTSRVRLPVPRCNSSYLNPKTGSSTYCRKPATGLVLYPDHIWHPHCARCVTDAHSCGFPTREPCLATNTTNTTTCVCWEPKRHGGPHRCHIDQYAWEEQ